MGFNFKQLLSLITSPGWRTEEYTDSELEEMMNAGDQEAAQQQETQNTDSWEEEPVRDDSGWVADPGLGLNDTVPTWSQSDDSGSGAYSNTGLNDFKSQEVPLDMQAYADYVQRLKDEADAKASALAAEYAASQAETSGGAGIDWESYQNNGLNDFAPTWNQADDWGPGVYSDTGLSDFTSQEVPLDTEVYANYLQRLNDAREATKQKSLQTEITTDDPASLLAASGQGAKENPDTGVNSSATGQYLPVISHGLIGKFPNALVGEWNRILKDPQQKGNDGQQGSTGKIVYGPKEDPLKSSNGTEQGDIAKREDAGYNSTEGSGADTDKGTGNVIDLSALKPEDVTREIAELLIANPVNVFATQHPYIIKDRTGVDVPGLFYAGGFVMDGDGIYHARQEWSLQSFEYTGYNDFYDKVFHYATDMNEEKFPFSDDDGNEYILWAWKGDYLNLGAGAEMGIYKRMVIDGTPIDQVNGTKPDHWLVDQSLAMPMTLTLDYNGKQIISYDPQKVDPQIVDPLRKSTDKWWVTGFNPDYQDVKASNLTASYTVDFSGKEGLYDAFIKSDRYLKNKSKWSISEGNKYKMIFTF